jgi:Tfp pilus assembly protein PilF
MIGLVPDLDRQLIPRWRNYLTTVELGELSSQKGISLPLPDLENLPERYELFKSKPSQIYASDLVGAAFLYNKPEFGREAARYLLADSARNSIISTEVAEKVLGIYKARRESLLLEKHEYFSGFGSNSKIKRLKRAIVRDPRSSIYWTDLAREYAIAGLSDKAKKAMEIALYLSPNNRFVVRSAARLSLHLDNPEYAYHIIKKSPLTKFDPWLVSAEIAIAEVNGKPSKFVKTGTNFLESDSFNPSDLSELASSIATLEAKNGNIKKGRKLFRQALISPNDNTVAQVEWVSRRFHLFEMDVKYLKVPASYEAGTLHYIDSSEWNSALESSKKWLDDQPFSSRPAIYGSYIASTFLEDFLEAERISERGLTANPNDPILLNNLAFALTNQNKVEEAEKVFAKINYNEIEPEGKTVWNATNGLIHYRKNDAINGRLFYEKAIELSSEQNDKRKKALAIYYYACEELRRRAENPESLFQRAQLELGSLEDQALSSLSKKLNVLYKTASGSQKIDNTK